jgi:hypothetical protein
MRKNNMNFQIVGFLDGLDITTKKASGWVKVTSSDLKNDKVKPVVTVSIGKKIIAQGLATTSRPDVESLGTSVFGFSLDLSNEDDEINKLIKTVSDFQVVTEYKGKKEHLNIYPPIALALEYFLLNDNQRNHFNKIIATLEQATLLKLCENLSSVIVLKKGCVVLQKAIALPYRGSILNYNGGVILPDNLISLRHTRNWKPCETYYDDYSKLAELKGDFVLIGPIYHHFGHMMAEMIHRILPTKEKFPNISKYIVISGDSNKDNQVLGQRHPQAFYLSLLNLFDIKPEDVVVINKPTVIERISITEQGSDLLGGPKDWYLDLLDKFMAERLMPRFFNKKRPVNIYVSRSSLSAGIIAGESYIEKLLTDFGFSTVHPELLSFNEQMEIYASAQNIIFSEGSAIHGLELFGRLKFKNLGIIARRSGDCVCFNKMLTPRCQKVFIAESVYLGSIWSRKHSDTPVATQGIALFNLNNLFNFLGQFGINIKEIFSISDFLEASEADLIRYMDYQTYQSRMIHWDFNPLSWTEINSSFDNYRKELSLPTSCYTPTSTSRPANTVKTEQITKITPKY